MNSQRPLFDSLSFSLVRIAPALVSLAVMHLPSDEVTAARYIEQILSLASTLLAWNLAEGTFAVYLRAKEELAPSARGYLFSTFIFGFLVLALLGVFRSCSTQGLFMLLLAVLSLRGMSRVSWDQSRLRVAMGTTVAAHSLLALLSFLCASDQILWQMAVFALGIGLATTSVELAWHSEALSASAPARIAAPLFRVSLIGGPLAVASLAFTGYLPFSFSLVYVAILPALKLLGALRRSGEPLPSKFRPTVAIYAAFVAIVVACHAYASRSVSG